MGVYKAAFGGGLSTVPPADPAALKATASAGIFLLLHAFASGGAAMTGVEAISNGVTAFKKPEWKNARETLMVMAGLLGTMFIGISWLAAKMQVVPTDSKTVISQVAQAVFGTGTVGHVLFWFVQIATMLILVLAANTSFADFPRLASFHANDHFMPKQLTKRGHRLVFSNGIIALAIAGAIPVIIFQADVSHLIPLYAIGVFTSFTLTQAGMAKKHITDKEPGWKVGLFVNGLGAVTTLVVTLVIGFFKFTGGAWFIMILVPVMVFFLVRLNHAYRNEKPAARARGGQGGQAPRSCATTRCWCWWSGSTRARPGPSSTPAPSRPTRSRPCTSPPTRWRPRSWPRSGPDWAWRACPSRSWSAPTGASPAAPSRSWPKPRPTATPR